MIVSPGILDSLQSKEDFIGVVLLVHTLDCQASLSCDAGF